LMSSSSDWMGVVAVMENSFTRIAQLRQDLAQLRQDLGFLFAADGAVSKPDLKSLGS
jgi:hypothetical protein